MNSSDLPIHLVINPRSGYGSQKLMLNDVRAELRRQKLPVVEYVTRSAGDATRRVRQIARQARAVLAWGGDGTANECANGLVGTGTPLLVAQAGTENLLAKELRIPRRPCDLVDVLLNGQPQDCDVGLINGQMFHSILGVGFDAEVVRRLSATRTGHISHLSYFWPIWRTFWEHDFPTLHVTSDGEQVFDGRGLVFVGNISRYATGLKICNQARFDDGLLDLVVFPCRQQTGLMFHAACTLLRTHPRRGEVIYRNARRIQVDTDQPQTCELDGDVGPVTPLEISLAPQRITLLLPASRYNRWSFPLWPWKGTTV